LEKEGKINIFEKFSFVAGHSLGEYSALCAAEVFDIQTTAKLLKIRGESMQEAVPEGLGSMIVLLGGSFEKAQELALEASMDKVCVVANDNSAEQIVLSGHVEALERASQRASEFGFKRSIKLDVSAPFHSPLMKSAAETMKDVLDSVTLKKPKISILPNVTAKPLTDEDIKELLVEQICGRVRWRETILELENQGVTQIIEIGQGKVLCGLSKRIAPEIQTFSLQSPEDFENLIKII
jgi:[acyl-carrier-protein] S-malonyltransferase